MPTDVLHLYNFVDMIILAIDMYFYNYFTAKQPNLQADLRVGGEINLYVTHQKQSMQNCDNQGDYLAKLHNWNEIRDLLCTIYVESQNENFGE